MSDLSRRLRLGDAAAFEGLVQEYGDRLYRFARRMVGDGWAEDVVQEVFIRVLKSAGSLESTVRFDGWIFSIANNLCVDHLRRQALARARERSREEPLDDPPSRGAEADEVQRMLRRAVAELPVEQKQVFLMREEGGLTFQQIAEALGCPLGTALARMRYAMDRLKLSLKPHRETI